MGLLGSEFQGILTMLLRPLPKVRDGFDLLDFVRQNSWYNG